MSVKVKRSGAWVAVPNGKLSVRLNGTWYPMKRCYIKRNGVWVDTGYLPKPAAPGVPFVTSWGFTQLSVASSAPSPGPYDSVLYSLYNQFGTLITEQTSGTFNVSADTKYIVRARSLSLGVSSDYAGDLRVWIGHPQQTATVQDYGWGGENFYTPPQINGTSAHENGQYPGANASDGNTNTSWVSGPRNVQSGGLAFEGLWFQLPGGNRLFTRALVYCGSPEVAVLAISTNGSFSGYNSAGAYGMAGSGYPSDPVYQNILIHDGYVLSSDTSSWPRNMDISGSGFNFQQIDRICIAITNLRPWPLAYRAEINDVTVGYRDWVNTGSHQVVTVAQQSNTYW